MNMKRLMLTLVITTSIAGIAAAQSSCRSTSTTTPSVSSPGSATTTPNGKSTTIKFKNLDQRDVYHWSNGQRATPTGEQAMAINGGYAALKKDTAHVKGNPDSNSRRSDDQQ